MTLRRTVPANQPGDLPRHVIAEYKHRAQTVLCECGWTGSTEAPGNGHSPWQAHVAEHRPPRR